MQFKLTKSHRYWWPVTVRLPDPEQPGVILEQELKIQFEPLGRDEQLAVQAEAAKLQTMEALVEHETRQALRIVKNWDGVVDDDGLPIPFSPELFSQAMQQSWFRLAVQEALNSSLAGEKARLGN